MRIAQVAPLFESVPPKFYGGTERVVCYLTEELVRLGHQVTLFASGDSVTRAELDAACARSLWADPDCHDEQTPQILQLERVLQRASEFDIIHFHIDAIHYPMSRRLRTPHLTTLHGQLDFPGLQALYDEFDDLPLVSISNSQRRPLPQALWCGTVYHGLPLNLHTYSPGPGDYFAFLGRICPDKGIEPAIEIAKRLNVPLKIAARIDRSAGDYYRDQIVPLLDHPLVEYIGEIGEHEKDAFLGGARALLFPIDWPEPFGLVMIEAMACGTPVIATRCGAAPELVDDGLTGFCVDGLDALVEAAARVHTIDRRRCRATFEQRFSASRMARDYLRTYANLPERGTPPTRRFPQQGADVAAE
jgi:glycosyltransferase involved in cell wall biosynthesis